jgi:hypothetical protein
MDVAENLEKLEASKTASLVTTMRSMAQAISARNLSDLLADAGLAQEVLRALGEREAAAAAARGWPSQYWAFNDQDAEAQRRLAALPEQRGRSRSPPPRGASLAASADAMEAHA